MNTHADKTQENKSQSVANALSKKQHRTTTAFQFEDNRSETVTQRKVLQLMNNNTQTKQLETNNNQPIQFMFRNLARGARVAARGLTRTFTPNTQVPSATSSTTATTTTIAERLRERQEARSAALEEERQRRQRQEATRRLARFHNADDPTGLLPPVMRDRNRELRPDAQEALEERLSVFRDASENNEGYRNHLIDGHITADTEDYPRSPLVSATDDILGATQSTDDSPEGVQSIVENATHLTVSSVPSDLVHRARGEQQEGEGEQVVEGLAMAEGVVSTTPNPFRGGTIRLSDITPAMIELLTRDDTSTDQG